MSHKPPHLDDAPEDEGEKLNPSFKKIGRQ